MKTIRPRPSDVLTAIWDGDRHETTHVRAVPIEGVNVDYMAEAGGFEPPVACATLAFKLCETTYGSRRATHHRRPRLGAGTVRTVANRHE